MAVDIPSGIHADTGAVMGTALKSRCNSDVWLGKKWEQLFIREEAMGEKVLVEDIGFPEMALRRGRGREWQTGTGLCLMKKRRISAIFNGRKADSK